jgi:hypothetical protein
MKKAKSLKVKSGNKKTSRKVVCKRCRKSKKIHAKDLCGHFTVIDPHVSF